MPRSTKFTRKRLVHTEHISGSVRYSNFVTHRLTRQSRDRTRRKKPQHFTVTPLPYVYTESEEKATCRFISKKYFSGIPYQWTTLKIFPYGSYHRDVTPDLYWSIDFLNKVKSLKGYNLSGYIGEYPETINLFTVAAKGLHDVARVARGKSPKHSLALYRKWKSTKRKPKDISSAWLFSHFAVAPNLDLLSYSLTDLHNKLIEPLPYEEVYVKKQAVRHVKKTYKILYNDSAVSDILEVQNIEHKIKARIVFKTGYRNEFQAGNILEAAWEGVPFSFVVDWMFNVGDTLSALDALNGVDSLIGTNTKRTKIITYFTPKLSSKMVNSVTGLRYRFSHERETLSKGSIPPLQLPSYQPSDSLGALSNAIALLHVLRK